jgi:beta-galactosidase GanA
MTDEVRETAQGFHEARDFLNGTRPTQSGLAVHLSTLAWAQFRFQPMVNGFDYLEFMKYRVYRNLMDIHLRADIIDPAAPLDAYRLVFSPFLPALEESGLRDRIRSWIENGGTWVVGPFSDIRDVHGTKPRHAPFAVLEDWAGVCCKYELPGEPREIAMRWDDGTKSRGSLWYSGLEPKQAEVTATYAEGPLKGLAAVTETHVGKGRIVLLGTLPIAEDLQRLMLRLGAQCGVHPSAEATPNVLVVPRHGEAGEGMVVLELHNEPGKLTLPNPAMDLLSKSDYSGDITISPYQVLVLRPVVESSDTDGAESRRRANKQKEVQQAASSK